MSNIAFLTYVLETSPMSGGTLKYSSQVSYGYTTPIHCNYIQQIEIDDFTNVRINFSFDEELFPFMKDPSEIGSGNSGEGWCAYKIKALIQIVTGVTSGTTVLPDASKWKSIDLTDQIENHVAGQAISPSGLTETLFEIDPLLVSTFTDYRLTYLNYPNALTDKLAFGEEVFFFGNVKTDIEAVGYVTDIAVNLPANEYNYTENPTWDGVSKLYISEIGVFDDTDNLVGIAKLNSPIDKDTVKARSFAFNIEF
jgi:hypothetical protein